jgi:ribulose-bisphosphate carboxylase large chain
VTPINYRDDTMTETFERVCATYLIETAFPLEAAAEGMAGEQSTGTFVRLQDETEELREAHGARVESIVERESAPAPSLPGAKIPKGVNRPVWRRAHVQLSWPTSNFGISLPNVLATVAGNLFELGQFSGLRLLDLSFPASFAQACPGPAFGVEGTRQLAGVERGPLVGTIVKPSVGLSPESTAAIVRQLCEGGIDFIKDDELQANGPCCPLEARVQHVMAVLNDHADRAGKRVMYAFNITDDLEAMHRHHDTVLAAGGTCVMVSLNSVGLVGLQAVRRHSALPIHAHRNGWGALSRAPMLGFSYIAWQKLWRLAGVDHMHVNGLRNKFSEDDESVIISARACLSPMFDTPHRGFKVMPVFSSGQWAGQAADTFAALGSSDLIYASGGGIMAHPTGIAAGVSSIREAWDAAQQGVDLSDYALNHPALAAAFTAFNC